MSAIDNTEVSTGFVVDHSTRSKQSPTKTIHFSDGSTMEVDDDQIDQNKGNVQVEEQHECHHQHSTASSSSINTKSLSWSEWMKHYSNKGTNSMINGLDYAGETVAYYLGITTPKYQHEIDEYNRMVKKKTEEEAEAKSWASTDPSFVPIVLDQVRSASQEITTSDNIDQDTSKV